MEGPAARRKQRSRRRSLETVQSKRIDAKLLITHRFKLDRILRAYETFGNAADTTALKVIVET